MLFDESPETLDLAKRDVDFEARDAEGAGAPALMVKEGGTDAKYSLGLLFVVKTDSGGLCGATCGDVYTATSLSTVSPGLTVSSPSLPISTTVAPYVSSPSTEQTTSVTVARDC